MLNKTQEIYKDGKKSLDTLLREKAYDEVKEILLKKGINIDDVEEADVEALVAEKMKDMQNGLKGFGIGIVTSLLISALTGI